MIFNQNMNGDEIGLVPGKFYAGIQQPGDIPFLYSGSLKGNNPHFSSNDKFHKNGGCCSGVQIRHATEEEKAKLIFAIGETYINHYEIY